MQTAKCTYYTHASLHAACWLSSTLPLSLAVFISADSRTMGERGAHTLHPPQRTAAHRPEKGCSCSCPSFAAGRGPPRAAGRSRRTAGLPSPPGRRGGSARVSPWLVSLRQGTAAADRSDVFRKRFAAVRAWGEKAVVYHGEQQRQNSDRLRSFPLFTSRAASWAEPSSFHGPQPKRQLGGQTVDQYPQVTPAVSTTKTHMPPSTSLRARMRWTHDPSRDSYPSTQPRDQHKLRNTSEPSLPLQPPRESHNAPSTVRWAAKSSTPTHQPGGWDPRQPTARVEQAHRLLHHHRRRRRRWRRTRVAAGVRRLSPAAPGLQQRLLLP